MFSNPSHLISTFYLAGSASAVRELGIVGVPATLIIDRAGNEVGRVIGPAEWDSPDIIDLLKTVMAKADNPNERAGGNESLKTARYDTPGLLTRGVEWLKVLIK